MIHVMEYASAPSSPPWRFRLIALTALSVVAMLAVVTRAASARRRDASARAQVIGELRRLDDQQTAWEARHGLFARRIGTVADDTTLAFTPTPGVELRFDATIPSSWSAIATTDRLLAAPRQCGVYRGRAEAAPHRAVLTPGEVACW